MFIEIPGKCNNLGLTLPKLVLMKEGIEQWLRKDGYWKGFIGKDVESRKDALLIDLDVITLEQENEKIHFNVSIIYTCIGGRQKQIIESGIATISSVGILKDVSCNT